MSPRLGEDGLTLNVNGDDETGSDAGGGAFGLLATPASPNVAAASSTSGATPGAGLHSRFFVDQMTALREAHRNERAQWQREATSMRSLSEDANRRADGLDRQVMELRRALEESRLAVERQAQLMGRPPASSSSSTTLLATPDSPSNVGGGSGSRAASVAMSPAEAAGTPDGLLFLKKAVFRFITADEDSERETLLPVIAALLKFSSDEVETLKREVRPPAPPAASGVLSLLSGLVGSSPSPAAAASSSSGRR